MYVDSVRIENFRTYRHAEIDLLHPDRTASDMKRRFPADILYPNINLVLGNNGMGKSAFLKAIALGCLGPTVRDSGIFPYRFVRREPGSADVTAEIKRKLKVPGKPLTMPSTRSIIKSVFITHPQDRVPKGTSQLISSVRIDRRADLESLQFLERRPGSKAWNSIFHDDVDAFFFVGYGASRRTEERSNVDQAGRRRTGSVRAQRVRSLFEDDATMIPLSFWLPSYSKDHPDRAEELMTLMNAITGPDHYRFTGELEKGEYLFQRQDQLMPFPALSDGYRAFFGWLSDLLYHVCQSASPGTPLVENRGIVMIDTLRISNRGHRVCGRRLGEE
jgi:AAA domain